MSLNADTLAARLKRPHRFYPHAGSTNDLARAWLLDGAPAGSVIVADEQRSGRGRLGRGWATPPGVALAVSVILLPPRDALHQLTMLGALSIAETLDLLAADAPHAVSVGIKWPNDVLLAGKKVSGVLVESEWAWDTLRGAVVGMGLNVRVDFSGTDLADKAISIEPSLGRPVDRTDLLVALLARVDHWAARLGTPGLQRAWTDRLVTLGQRVTVSTAQGTYVGLAEGVGVGGALLLRDDHGTLHTLHAGDIALG